MQQKGIVIWLSGEECGYSKLERMGQSGEGRVYVVTSVVKWGMV
jgi:hypothetical protein